LPALDTLGKADGETIPAAANGSSPSPDVLLAMTEGFDEFVNAMVPVLDALKGSKVV